MLSNTQTLAPKPALPPAAPAVAPSNPANATGGPSFAQFLTQQAGPPPAKPVPGDAEADAPEATQATARPPQARKPAPAKPAHAEAKPPGDAADKTIDKTAGKTAGKDGVEPGADAPDDTDGLDELTQLIGLAPGQAAPTPPAADATAATQRRSLTAGEDDDRGAGRPARTDGDRPTELPSAARAARAGDAQRGKQAELRAEAQAAGRDADVAQGTSGSATTTTATPQAAPIDAAAPSFAAALAQALPTAAVRSDAAPAATPPLQAPLHSPAFAPELGARVSLLAVDGVQQAELTLNPADMGPVSVQIVVDGSQAQVSFHAAQAETRQALEQSLPDLAAALQGQGLTLSGGGVFQQAPRDADHAREAGERDDGRRGSRVGAAGGTASGATASAQRRTVGLLDTFA